MGKHPRIVEVEWEDSCATEGWHRVDARNYGPAVCRTAGYLVAEKKKSLTIAVSLHASGGNADGVITIPKSAVIKRRTLK